MVIRIGWLVLVLVHFFPCLESAGDELTYFRRDFGVAPGDSRVPTRFDDSTMLWRVPLEHGHSTPTIVGDAVFLTTFDAATEEHATLALDRRTGRVLWRRVAPTDRVEPQHQIGSPASATVASDGERVYAYLGSYGLLCYALDGAPVWSRPLGPFQDEYGSSSSPILADGRLLLNEDHDIHNFLIALDARTGETVWEAPRDEFTRSYATPTIWRHAGRTEVVMAGSLQLASYDLQTGEKLWWVNGLARIVNTTPVVHDDRIYVATWSPGADAGERIGMEAWADAAASLDKNGDGRIARDELDGGPVLTRFYRIDLNQDGGLDQAEWERHAEVFQRAENVTLAMRAGGSGDLTDSAVLWKTPTGAPYVCSPLLHDGVLYLAKDGGIFTSLDAETGVVIKRGRLRGRGNYYASPVAADGKILAASQNGVLSVLTAAGDWDTLTSHDFGEGIYATPVFDDGKLYIRTEKAMYCFAQNP